MKQDAQTNQTIPTNKSNETQTNAPKKKSNKTHRKNPQPLWTQIQLKERIREVKKEDKS